VPNFLEVIDYCKSQVKIETKKTEVKRGKRAKENEQAVQGRQPESRSGN